MTSTSSDLSNITAEETGWFTQEQLSALAEKPENVVYQYTYDTPELTRSATFLEEQLQTCRDRYLELKETQPTWTTEQIRDLLSKEKYSWRELRRHYTLSFEKVTDPELTSEGFQVILFLISQKRKLEQGELTLDQGRVMVEQRLMAAYGPVKRTVKSNTSKPLTKSKKGHKKHSTLK